MSRPPRRPRGARRLLAAAVTAGLAGSALVGCSTPPPTAAVKRPAGRPNIVFVLTDDLSWNLVRFMPHVEQMERDGVTFEDYFVTDSLCCPSRASIFTGELPHDTGVYSNTGSDGGFREFDRRDDEERTFALALSKVGYDNAMMGKYLNGYQPWFTIGRDKGGHPPGWDEWDVAGDGYPEFDYDLNEDGRIVHYGTEPQDYLTDVLSERATDFIDRAATKHRPFLLEVATFAPHSPFVPAPRDAKLFPGLQAPRTPAFNRADTVGNPVWLRAYKPLTRRQIAIIDEDYRLRAQSVVAVDEMIGRLEATVAARGLSDDTYFVFSSDNGLHMGEHRMMPGKMTAFDTDIHVPLIVAGPGIAAGSKVTRLTENIDLCPTFEQLGHAKVAATVDGTSLVPLLFDEPVASWRKAVLIEHHGPDFDKADPDYPPPASGNPPSYEAMRLQDAIYVEYADGEREYYDLATDPYELRNIVGELPASRLATLHAELEALEHCHGGVSCHRAEALEDSGGSS